jgi:hypothetical protein
MHEFEVTKTGYYVLQEDIAGGSSYTMRTDWSDTTSGKRIDGTTDEEYGVRWRRYYNTLREAVYDSTTSPFGGTIVLADSILETFTPDSNEDIIQLTTGTYLQLNAGYELDYTKSGGIPSYGISIFKVDGDSNVVIDGQGALLDGNVDTTNSYQSEFDHGILLTNAKNITIKNLRIKNMSGDGIYIGGGCDNILIDNVTIDVNIQDFSVPGQYGRNGIAITGGKNIKIVNSTINGGWPAGIDIELASGLDDSVDNVIIDNCIFGRGTYVNATTVHAGGVEINSPENNASYVSKISNVAITNSLFINRMGPAIYTVTFQDAGVATIRGLKILNNTVKSCLDDSHAYAGSIVLRNIDYVECRGNTVRESSKSGIAVQGNTYGVILDNNVLEENQDHGIYLVSAGFDSVISDTSHSASQDTVYLLSTNNHLYTGDASGNFIPNQMMSNLVVTNNRFYKNALSADTSGTDFYCYIVVSLTFEHNISLNCNDSLRYKWNFAIRNVDSLRISNTNHGFSHYVQDLRVTGQTNAEFLGTMHLPIVWEHDSLAAGQSTTAMTFDGFSVKYPVPFDMDLIGMWVWLSDSIDADTIKVRYEANGVSSTGFQTVLNASYPKFRTTMRLDPTARHVKDDLIALTLNSTASLSPSDTINVKAGLIAW